MPDGVGWGKGGLHCLSCWFYPAQCGAQGQLTGLGQEHDLSHCARHHKPTTMSRRLVIITPCGGSWQGRLGLFRGVCAHSLKRHLLSANISCRLLAARRVQSPTSATLAAPSPNHRDILHPLSAIGFLCSSLNTDWAAEPSFE